MIEAGSPRVVVWYGAAAVPNLEGYYTEPTASGAMDTTELASVWSGATSLLMCLEGEAPPGDAASDRERMLRDVHARQLLVRTGADPERLAALAFAARRRARSSARGWGALSLARRRLAGSGNRRWAFGRRALTRSSRATVAAHWTAGAEIAESAAALVLAAGDDPPTRSHVLADAKRALARTDWRSLLPPDPAAR